MDPNRLVTTLRGARALVAKGFTQIMTMRKGLVGLVYCSAADSEACAWSLESALLRASEGPLDYRLALRLVESVLPPDDVLSDKSGAAAPSYERPTATQASVLAILDEAILAAQRLCRRDEAVTEAGIEAAP